jgi:tRNA(Ile)-lysidine synthase
MKEPFLAFIKEHNLFDKEDKILLTISGGIDSMAMLYLFIECDFNISIAHCNFQLRGAESDGDQELVERFAQKNQIPIHINRFDTLGYAEQNKVSIQMAARELRYSWFERLAKENGYNCIATGHNANDVIETFLINLTRGTGIHGLTGINIINGNIIRPLLFATREQIIAYAQEKNIAFREDSSNAETKYLRNAIRHEIIPRFRKLNESFIKNVTHTSTILKDAEQFYNKSIDDLQKLILTKNADLIYISIASIKSHGITAGILYEMIHKYGFTFDTATRIIKNIDNQPGATYFSASHKIVKDRTSYILYPLAENEQEEFYIEKNTTNFDGPPKFEILKTQLNKDLNLYRNQAVAIFDAAKLKFPLKLRHWQHGDFFYPFGMRGKKKISDYFSDQKFTTPEKDNTWLLLSGNDIIWVVNHRTDNRYAITNSTKEVVQFELKQ